MYYTLTQGTVKKIDSLLMISNSFDAIGRNKIKFVQPNNSIISSLQSGDWTTASIWSKGIIPSLTTPAVINTGHTITIPASTTVQAGTLYDAGTLKFLSSSRLQLGTLAPVRGAALQVIEFAYNVRSQMRGVNLDANDNPQVSQDKLFSYKIDYHEDGRYFDNSISKQTWKAQNSPQNRSYLYTYDRANRLLNSQYTGVGNENYSVSQGYDANGNILNLQRYSKTGTNTFGLVDNLTYSYLNNGNKLLKIDDAITGNTLANDFRDVSGNDYAFSVDGKMTKDGNKNISSIRYNYLDLVSSIKFGNSDSVSYWYSSTGSRIQRKVVKSGQPDSYTIYDGEMVYSYTGASPGLAVFGIAEIQNSEGRYVNGKLEYGYTDHVGNLRLSYKDSLGVAFITQSQSYDPWSNVNAGSEYQLSGIQGDRYLVSGKENDSITGNTLLDWRDYDSVTGRMNSFDPDGSEGGQISLSPFAYSWNRPSMLNDPDGRCPMCIGFMIGIFTSAIGNMASGKMPSSIGQFLLPGVVGAISGGIAGGVNVAMAGGKFGAGLLGTANGVASTGFLSGLATGGAGGFSNGLLNGLANGKSFSESFKMGAIDGLAGGVIGGLTGGLDALSKGTNFWNGTADLDLTKGFGAHNIPAESLSDKYTGKYVGRFEGVNVYESSELGNFNRPDLSGGITLPGRGITVGQGVFTRGASGNIDLLKHEFGHILQSKELGNISFYKNVGIPSIKSASGNGINGHWHNSYWTEIWANRLSSTYFAPYKWNSSMFPLEYVWGQEINVLKLLNNR
jgi:RHS repeat-associated protein